ncbi:pyridoxamine 5'-phosphate oxidase family protein [Pseudohalocynthiibacter sp. F2068]|uniref:FAD-binding oxidoreductase n=1 Tax=Pseudohalocynthiibacter sp. F2068 TaxID=2926418 RepID=UPI001FF52C87|nr:pyridoxamine 5'-phosphate oxidase family protein [Pseudohalocynthiibacter sp. F2068]MCK0104589.1 FAD-binding oxidoreductase [Pseudohalocynthiibacter sp. F2068]
MTEQNKKPSGASPFHRGEHAVQKRLGVRDIEDWAQKVVRDFLPDQHREFHTALPFLVAAARDENNRPWVTLLEGPDGFVTSPDPRHLVIEAKPSRGDALEYAFVTGADVGILGIELAARRRNRVNGRVAEDRTNSIAFAVEQSFGNCPQYIRERKWHRAAVVQPREAIRGSSLTDGQREWIGSADTFFIATGFRGDGESPTFGMDASHRGGDRGFVQVINKKQLRFPDYAGNNHYNTIGNLVLDPRAGYLFIDFESGSLLQLTGTTSINWEPDDLTAFPGTRRLITLDIEEIVELPSAVGLRWQVDADSVRSLRLVEKTPESEDVTSFVFEARDGGPLPVFEPGQHLPIEFNIPGTNEPARRTYSLSSAPTDDRYRISVKREPKGLVSRYIHDAVEPGSIIESRHPAGDFMMTCNICPLVLISAGVGITPMVSILRAIVAENSNRPAWFVHGARDGRHHPFAREVRDLVADRPNIKSHVQYSRPQIEDTIGTHYDAKGRITGKLLAELVNNVDAHYFLCGPTPFMAQIRADLEEQSIPVEQIHHETFGPVG